MTKSSFFIKILLFSVFLCFGMPKISYGWEPFGGMIVNVTKCECSNNEMVFHTQAAGPSPVMYQPGVSKLYEFKKIEVGEWFLGNVSIDVPCIKQMGPICVSVGSYPLIIMTGTSGSQGDSSSGANPVGSTPTPTPTTPPTPPGTTPGNTPTGGGVNNNANENTPANETQNRQTLSQNGIGVYSSGNCSDCANPSCTCVGGLSDSSMNGVTNLRQQSGSPVTVTGGTEGGHHRGCSGNCVDINHDPSLDNYIQTNAQSTTNTQYGTRYNMADGTTYLFENAGATPMTTGSHIHAEYGPRSR